MGPPFLRVVAALEILMLAFIVLAVLIPAAYAGLCRRI
jgi:hypothetical protein